MNTLLLSTLSTNGVQLEELEILELGENYFTQIDDSTFSMLPNLRNISLANNRIQKVAANTFNKWETSALIWFRDFISRNTKLVELVLRNNHIMSESLPIFEDFESLVKLDLSNNHLAHVSKAYFGKMKKLKILRLNNNKITYLTSLAFHNLVEIEQDRVSNDDFFQCV